MEILLEHIAELVFIYVLAMIIFVQLFFARTEKKVKEAIIEKLKEDLDEGKDLSENVKSTKNHTCRICGQEALMRAVIICLNPGCRHMDIQNVDKYEVRIAPHA